MASILVVDSDETIRNVIAVNLERAGHKAVKATSYDHAEKLMERNACDIVITGLKTYLNVLRAAKSMLSDAEVIVIVDHEATETARRAMESGAWDYMTKPISLQQLSLSIHRALEKRQLTASVKRLRKQVMERFAFQNVVAGNEKMLHAVELAKRASAANSPLLITGESGTGKQLLANIIHNASARRQEPFISVDLSTIDQDFMELTLFGSISNLAARGAHIPKSAKGAIERADRGTIFLNEITFAPPGVQEKLLELLQYNVVSRTGSEEMIYVDARLVVTSSADTEESMRSDRFQADLFHQLSQSTIHLPPLKERKNDIPILAERFVGIYSKQFGKGIDGISPESISLLISYDWPGNVRELKNAMEWTAAFASERIISPANLPCSVRVSTV